MEQSGMAGKVGYDMYMKMLKAAVKKVRSDDTRHARTMATRFARL